MKKFILIVCLFTSSLQSMQKIDQRLQSELNESLFKVLYKPVVREDRRARQVLNALYEGADVNAREPKLKDSGPTNFLTPLMIAAHYGMNTIVSILLENGADKTLRSLHNYTPEELARNNHQHPTAQLISNWRQSSEKKVTDKVTRDSSPIFEMIRKNEIQAIRAWLGTATDLRARDMEGYTLFHRAALCQNTKIMELLYNWRPVFLSEGNEYDGRTPLLTAITHGHVNILEWILARNKSCLSTDRDRYNFASPLLIAATEAPRDCRYTIMELLLNSASPQQFRTDIDLLLYFGVCHADRDLVQFALELGANPYNPLPKAVESYQAAAGICNKTPIEAALPRHNNTLPAGIEALLAQERPLRIAMRREYAKKDYHTRLEGELKAINEISARRPLISLSSETCDTLLVAGAVLGWHLHREGMGLFEDPVRLAGKLIVTGALSIGAHKTFVAAFKLAQRAGYVWGRIEDVASRISERVFVFMGSADDFMHEASDTSREIKAAAVALKDSTLTLSQSVKALINDTRKVVVTIGEQVRDASGVVQTVITKLGGTAEEVGNAIQKGIDEGKFKPDCKVDIEHVDVRIREIKAGLINF